MHEKHGWAQKSEQRPPQHAHPPYLNQAREALSQGPLPSCKMQLLAKPNSVSACCTQYRISLHIGAPRLFIAQGALFVGACEQAQTGIE